MSLDAVSSNSVMKQTQLNGAVFIPDVMKVLQSHKAHV